MNKYYMNLLKVVIICFFLSGNAYGQYIFTIYAYKNSGVYQGRYVTIKRATGNVGIGVTDPGTYKLAIGGTLATRKVKVTHETWADFAAEGRSGADEKQLH